MLTLHPNILELEGKKAFAVLPYEEFKRVQEKLCDYEDIRKLRDAKAEEAKANTTPLHFVREELNI